MKRFSKFKGFSIKSSAETVTEKDVNQYRDWLENPDKVNPDIRYDFKSDGSYINFMNNLLGENNGIPNYEPNHSDEIMDSKIETKTLTFSGLVLPNLDTKDYGTGNLVATILISQYFAHLYHFTSYGDLTSHLAFEMYYKTIADVADELGEKLMSSVKITEFRNEVFPKGSAIDYFERLKSYVDAAAFNIVQMPEIHKSSFQSLIDDVINKIDMLLYKLKLLVPTDKNLTPSEAANEGVPSQVPMDAQPVQQPPISTPMQYESPVGAQNTPQPQS